jgi:hypothetical protein
MKIELDVFDGTPYCEAIPFQNILKNIPKNIHSKGTFFRHDFMEARNSISCVPFRCNHLSTQPSPILIYF